MNPRKSDLIRPALATLEQKTEEEGLRREIAESVRRCANADARENLELAPAGVARQPALG
jgi:hypothetical protein